MGASRARVALVIEDEGLIRLLIADELRTGGWSVHEVETGEQAVSLIQTNRVDIVVTDIELGGALNGWDVAEACRATHPQIAVVYTSGNAVVESRMVPNSMFFGKPYDTREVLAACDRLMAR